MAATSIRIGWSSVDITPERRVLLWGMANGGKALRVADQSDFPNAEVAEIAPDTLRLTATALALSSGDIERPECAVIISCDLGAANFQLDRDLRNRLELRRKEANCMNDLDFDKIFLIATHTHCAPYTFRSLYQQNDIQSGEIYRSQLIEKLAVLVENAWLARDEGMISMTSNKCVLGWARIYKKVNDENFRVFIPDDRAGMVPITNPDPASDSSFHQASYIFTFDKFNNLSGVVANVACPAQDIQNIEAYAETYMSSDYWGLVRQKLKEWDGGKNAFLLPMLAFAGELGPWDFQNGDSAAKDPQNLDRANKHANAVFDSIASAFEGANERFSNMEFRHEIRIRSADCKQGWKSPDTIPSDWEKVDLERIVNFDPTKWGILPPLISGSYNAFAQLQLDKGKAPNPPSPFNYELHGIRLGNAAIVNNPCEIFWEYGEELRTASKANLTFLAQLSSGDRCAVHYYANGNEPVNYCGAYPGYIPRKVYEGDNTAYSERNTEGPISPEGGRQMVADAVALISELFPER